jgi:hypothetical protein
MQPESTRRFGVLGANRHRSAMGFVRVWACWGKD